MKKFVLFSLSVLLNYASKGQTIFNNLPSGDCDIIVEVYCVAAGYCNGLPPVPPPNLALAPTYTQRISPGTNWVLPTCPPEELIDIERVYRIKIDNSDCHSLVEWWPLFGGYYGSATSTNPCVNNPGGTQTNFDSSCPCGGNDDTVYVYYDTADGSVTFESYP